MVGLGIIAANRRRSAGTPSGVTWRYFRLDISAGNGAVQSGVSSFTVASTVGGSDRLSGKTVVVSSFDSAPYVGGNAVDNDLTTDWLAGSGWPQWIKVDVGAGNEFSPAQLKIGCPSGGSGPSRAPKNFTLSVSNDDVTYTVVGTWTNETTWTASTYNSYSLSVPSAPSFSVTPTISTDTGFYGTGDVATVSYTHNGTSTSYQWTRDGANIGGATSASYTYVSGDVGHSVTCVVTAINWAYSTPSTAPGHAIVTPTFSSDYLLTAGDMQSGTDKFLTAGDMQSGTDRILIKERTA